MNRPFFAALIFISVTSALPLANARASGDEPVNERNMHLLVADNVQASG